MTNLGSILKSRDITLSTKVRLVVRRVYRQFCLRLNKNLKRRTLEPSACHSSQTDRVIALGSRTDHVIALGQISVTALCSAQFYLENNRKIHPWGVRAGRPKDAKRRERERTSAGRGETLQLFGSSFYMFFFLSLGLPYVKWASQECCLFYLRSSLWSSDPPLFCFLGFSLPCLLAITILDSFFLF